MNHPIITAGNANARLNKLMQEAEQHRRAQGFAPQRHANSLFAKISNRLTTSNRKPSQKRLAKTSA